MSPETDLLTRLDHELGDLPEDRIALLAELRRLPAMQRRTVVLRYWLGFSVEDTAQELSISAGTVKSHARGRATLRERLGQDLAVR